jgi:hypothetical protein
MSRGIFIKAERKSASGWERAEAMVPNPERENEDWMRIVKKTPGWEKRYPKMIREPVLTLNWSQRVLSRVLSYGSGFNAQKVEIGQGIHLFDPVAPMRGFPEDASNETRSDFASFTYGESDHPDPSWLLLREVLDYDWKQEYVQWSQRAIAPDAPPQFSPVPEGEGWEPYGEPMQGKPWYGKVQIFLRRTGKTIAEAVGSFYTDSLPRLQTYGDPEDVRIVFWYEY